VDPGRAPQAIPNVLPALGNYLVAAFKDAPLGYVVNAAGILFFANSVRGGDFRAVEPYLLMGVGLPARQPARRVARPPTREEDRL
jgi:polar amino acid transport system permease protein